MVYKGYETMYHFTKLLLANPDTFINKVSDGSYKVSSDYNFVPVRLSPDFFCTRLSRKQKIVFHKDYKWPRYNRLKKRGDKLSPLF